MIPDNLDIAKKSCSGFTLIAFGKAVFLGFLIYFSFEKPLISLLVDTEVPPLCGNYFMFSAIFPLPMVKIQWLVIIHICPTMEISIFITHFQSPIMRIVEIGITGGSFENEPNTYGVRKKSLFKQKSFTELVEIWLTK